MQCLLFCEPLTCQPVTLCQGNFEHLSGLKLADPANGSDRLEIDILVGSDYYGTLLTGKVKRGPSGPFGVQTELGWVLSGPVKTHIQERAQTTLVMHTLHVENLATTELKGYGNFMTNNTYLQEYVQTCVFYLYTSVYLLTCVLKHCINSSSSLTS